MARHWQMASPASVVIAEPDPGAALERALRGPGPVVVAGSLYLVGAMRDRLVRDAIRDADDGAGVDDRAGADDGAGAADDADEGEGDRDRPQSAAGAPTTARRAPRPKAGTR